MQNQPGKLPITVSPKERPLQKEQSKMRNRYITVLWNITQRDHIILTKTQLYKMKTAHAIFIVNEIISQIPGKRFLPDGKIPMEDTIHSILH